MVDRNSDRRGTQPFWAAGTILVLATILLGMIIYAFFEIGWSYREADIGVGAVAAIATIALALGIYYQGIQNQDLIAQNETISRNAAKQSMILQESEWMPDPVFQNDRARFRFLRNRPYYPKVKLTIMGKDSDWVPLGVGHKDHQSGHREWYVGIGGEFRDMFALDDGIYSAELCLKLESITGSEYKYKYDVDVELDDGSPIFTDSKTVERKLPWDDVTE